AGGRRGGGGLSRKPAGRVDHRSGAGARWRIDGDVKQLCAQEISDFAHEPSPTRIAFEDEVVAALEWHESRALNAGSEPPSLVEWLHGILATVEHQGRNLYLWQQVGNVQLVRSLTDPYRILGRGRNPL